MFVYEKKLQYPVRIANPNPKLAAFIISQYGGPDGELGASLRYLSQRYSMPYASARACAWPRRRWTRKISTSSTRPSINKRKNAPAFVSEGRGIFR